MQRFLRSCGIACAVLVLGGAVAYAAFVAWVGALAQQELQSPSTARVVLLADGRRLPLEPSNAVLPAPTATRDAIRPTAVVDAAVPAASADAAAPAPAPVLLPPERLLIPAIDASWPVTLADVDHLPAYRGVGWLFGSAFPGTAGNLVLFGHAGGPHATFARLHELRPGDDIVVQTEAGSYQYRVRLSYETTPDDVAVMMPGDEPLVTLITCSGPWIPEQQTNARRLIVVAGYVAGTP